MFGKKENDNSPKVSKEFKGIVQSNFEKAIENDAISAIGMDIKELNLTWDEDHIQKKILGNNNKTFVLERKGDSKIICVVFGERKNYVSTALQELAHPSFLADYISISETPILDFKTNQPTDTNHFCQIIEYLPKSLAELGESNKDSQNFNKITRDVFNILTQCANIVEALNKNKIIWTDFKTGNLLLDDSNQIKIADTKAFVSHQDIPIRKDFISFQEVSSAFLSEYGRNKFIKGDVFKRQNMQEAIDLWQKEYCHIIGLILYQIVTGKESPKTLDFNHAYFKNHEGKQVAKIIKGLTNPSIKHRYTLADALKKLSELKLVNAEEKVINNPVYKPKKTLGQKGHQKNFFTLNSPSSFVTLTNNNNNEIIETNIIDPNPSLPTQKSAQDSIYLGSTTTPVRKKREYQEENIDQGSPAKKMKLSPTKKSLFTNNKPKSNRRLSLPSQSAKPSQIGFKSENPIFKTPQKSVTRKTKRDSLMKKLNQKNK